MAEIWEEPVRGAYPDPRVLGLPGIDQMRLFLEHEGPKPPIHYLTGMRPTEVHDDGVSFTMPASPWLQAPPGGLYPGTLAILADGPLGTTVQTALPPLTVYATAELSLSYVRPCPADGRVLTCRGTLVMAGKTLGLASCTIEDDRGRLVATGSTRCFIFPPFGPPLDEPPAIDVWEEPTWETPHPFERAPSGGVVPPEIWAARSGLEIMELHLADELPRPPYYHLTGCRPIEVSEGSATFVMPANPWLNAPTGKPIGGATAMLADSAIQAAVQTTVPPGTSYAPVDLKVNFVRPVEPDGRELTTRGVVQHRGKTMAVATAELVNADGKKVALATGSTLILPGRPWSAERPVDVAEEASAHS